MYCQRCGDSIPDNAVFCPSCGFAIIPAAVVETKTRKRQILLILTLSLALFAVSFFLIRSAPSILDNGNRANGGLSILVKGKSLYADNSVVYADDPDSNLVQVKFKKDTYAKSVYSAGTYHDLCRFSGKTYCSQEFNTADGSWIHQLVRFDDRTHEKEVLFPDLTDVEICGVINNCLYFIETNNDSGYHYSELYHLTEEGELIEDKIYNPRYITSSGVFVNSNMNINEGLELVSFDGECIRSFRSLRGYLVGSVMLLRDNYLYFNGADVNESYGIYCLDTNTDAIVNITEKMYAALPEYDVSMAGNTYNGDKMYYVFNMFDDSGNSYSELFISDMLGDNVQYICTLPVYSNIWSMNFADSHHLILTDAWTHDWVVVDTNSGNVLTEE